MRFLSVISMLDSLPKYLLLRKLLHFQFHIHACRKIKVHELIDRLIRRLNDVNEAFMRPYHKVFSAVPVYERTAGDVIVFGIRWQRYRTHDASTRSYCGIEYLLTAVIDDPAVIRF